MTIGVERLREIPPENSLGGDPAPRAIVTLSLSIGACGEGDVERREMTVKMSLRLPYNCLFFFPFFLFKVLCYFFPVLKCSQT